MNNKREVKLTDIAIVEKAKKGKIYPAGTVYIQVSAASHIVAEECFRITKESGTLEHKYAVIKPVVKCHPAYLQMALKAFSEQFMQKYVGSNINIQIESFNYFKLNWRDNYETQVRIAALFENVETQIENEEKVVEKAKQLKRYYLDNMFPK